MPYRTRFLPLLLLVAPFLPACGDPASLSEGGSDTDSGASSGPGTETGATSGGDGGSETGMSSVTMSETDGGSGDESGPGTDSGGIEPADAPMLRSWSGSTDCCGEDPHPVHGAVLADGSVVMVGKAITQGESTAGFLTRWSPPDGPAEGRFVDDDSSVIEGTMVLPTDSALLQVADGGGLILAAGFEATSPGEPARGVVLAVDPSSDEVAARLEVRAGEAGASAVLESLLVEDGQVIVGGATGLTRDQMEGFKSYGNVVGGDGRIIAFDLQAWLDASEAGDVVEPQDIGATTLTVPEIHSVKSMAITGDGGVAAVAHDKEEVSGLLWVQPGLASYGWTAFEDDFELTDVAASVSTGGVFLVGHGGEGTIDGHVKRVDAGGRVVWSRTFGNPGLAADDPHQGALAPDAFIFDECWGIAERDGELIAACGTGIEGCGAIRATPEEVSQCEEDPRRSWRSYLVGLDLDGDVQWRLAESFVDDAGEAAESAAEFVVLDSAGDVYAVVDQNFGVGLARYGR